MMQKTVLDVFVVKSWSCTNDEDECLDTFFAVCATQQLADQVLDRKGGHSFGYVRQMKIATTMLEAMGY
jgi:hypothetical protein